MSGNIIPSEVNVSACKAVSGFRLVPDAPVWEIKPLNVRGAHGPQPTTSWVYGFAHTIDFRTHAKCHLPPFPPLDSRVLFRFTFISGPGPEISAFEIKMPRQYCLERVRLKGVSVGPAARLSVASLHELSYCVRVETCQFTKKW
jgi:hypothetical protein